MTILRNYLTTEQFRSQGTTAGQVLAIGKFHLNEAKLCEEKKFYNWEAVMIEHRSIGWEIIEIAYKMDPSLQWKNRKHDNLKRLERSY